MNRREHDWRADISKLRALIPDHQPYPVLFATIGGADLYGFPSADGDYDIRGAHVLPLRYIISGSLNSGGLDTIRGMTVEAIMKDQGPGD